MGGSCWDGAIVVNPSELIGGTAIDEAPDCQETSDHCTKADVRWTSQRYGRVLLSVKALAGQGVQPAR